MMVRRAGDNPPNRKDHHATLHLVYRCSPLFHLRPSGCPMTTESMADRVDDCDNLISEAEGNVSDALDALGAMLSELEDQHSDTLGTVDECPIVADLFGYLEAAYSLVDEAKSALSHGTGSINLNNAAKAYDERPDR